MTALACQVVNGRHLLTEVKDMENFNDLKKAHYKQNTCIITEGGVIDFSPNSLIEVVGAEKMSYDEYLDVQIASLGKTRSYFEMCLFNHAMEFKGQVEKINRSKVCFKRIYISGMYPDGTMFDGREDHVWMDKKGFENLRVDDSVSFFAEVYRYVKISNGKQIDYSLRNPDGIQKIPSYELPTDRDLKLQSINAIICESCYLCDNCNGIHCIRPAHEIKNLQKQMLEL